MVDGSFLQLSLLLDPCKDHDYDLRLFHHPHRAQTLLLTHLLCFSFVMLANKRFVASVGFYLFFRFS
jgi:hypothetical protein